MNKQKLRAICMKVSKDTGLSYNSVQTHYFLEKILEKISVSNDKDSFIFKGGFLLSNVIGVGERSTVDIDFSVKRIELTEEKIREKLLNILEVNEGEVINYEIIKIEEIKKEDEYGGYCVSVLCRFENIKQIIPLDIATGDPVTPNEINFEYKSIFDDSKYNILAYNLETILAEKLQTIYHRGIFNSRSKDFYDVFILYKLKKNEIDFNILKDACYNTFKHRDTEFNINKIIKMLDVLENEEVFYTRWKNYQKKFPYAQGIKFDEIIESIKELIVEIWVYIFN